MQQDRIKPFLFYTGFFLCLLVWGFILLRWLIPATLPFWLGLLIAFLLRPLTLKISGKLHLRRRKAAVFATILFYSVLGIALWLLLSLVWGQLCALTANVPELYKTLFLPTLAHFFEWLSDLLSRFVPDLAGTVQLWMQSFAQTAARLSSNLSSWLLEICTQMAAKLPMWFLSVIVTIFCSAFISLDFPKVTGICFSVLPQKYRPVLIELKDFLTSTLFSMIKAYALLLGITFLELCAGLWLLGVRYFLPIAAGIALLDILPVLGTGTILIPWVLISFLTGNRSFAVGLLLLYLFITIARNFLEPKIVGDCIGLHPLVSLVSIYAGLYLFGVTGALLMPCLMLTANFLYQKRHPA